MPTLFAMAVLGYVALSLPMLVRNHFDPSVFIDLGDRFVNPAMLPSSVIVRPHEQGYDGQFYYRLALAPYRLQRSAFGITFDSPFRRTLRIGYPVLSWAIAFGHAAAVPLTMFLVNLLSLGAIATFAACLTHRLDLPALTPLAIMLWPGFIVALTHDTTEIVAVAFLLAALDCYFAKRLFAYAVLGALATLTRETSILVLAGILYFEAAQCFKAGHCFETGQAMRPGALAARLHRVVVCGIALVPFLVWWVTLRVVVGQTADEAVGNGDLSWPLLGAATMLLDTLTGIRHFAPTHRMDAAIRAYALGSAGWLLGFCALVAARTPRVVRMPEIGALAAGWLPVFALISLLTAGGPWIDQTAYFRAFTECFVVGCLVAAVRPVPRWSQWLFLVAEALMMIGAWGLAVGEK
jgi:hypothetical protein